MNQTLQKYLPWVVAILIALMAAYLGIQQPEGMRPPAPEIITVRDTILARDTVTVRQIVHRTVVLHDTASAAADTSRLAALVRERDSLNAEILALGETRADVDTTITLALGDSSHVTLRTRAMHEVERGFITITHEVLSAVLAVQGECTGTPLWMWITSATAALVAALVAVI